VQKACATDGAASFSLDFIPSIQFDVLTPPEKAEGVTGIFHYKVDRGVTP
jgi:hypothetical protein